jgi:hypothetical protein
MPDACLTSSFGCHAERASKILRRFAPQNDSAGVKYLSMTALVSPVMLSAAKNLVFGAPE